MPLTFEVKAAGWFGDAGGAALVDPAQANDGRVAHGPVRRQVRKPAAQL